MTIRQITSSNTKPTSMLYNSGYTWIAYTLDDTCLLQKTVSTEPSQVAIEYDVDVTAINKLMINGSYIYLAVNDSSVVGKRYSLTNPSATVYDFDTPVGITEEAVSVVYYSSYVYFLIPGVDSGTNAKILKYSLTGTYASTIDLSTVTNAADMVLDSNNEIRVVTFSSPVKLVRVYDLSTTPQFSITEITD